MAEDVSERRRREVPNELDDVPRRERETIEDGETQEEVSETREIATPSEYVDQHMDMVLHEIENRESTEERVSQGMDSALHRLEEMSQRSESTEKRLEEALESLEEEQVLTSSDVQDEVHDEGLDEERPVPAEKASASEASEDHYQAKLDDYTDLKDSSETPDTSPEAKMEHHEVYRIEREQLNETVRELDEVESVDVEHISIKIEELVRKSPDSESRIRVGDLSETDINDEQLDRIKQLLHEEGQAIRDNLRERFANEENDDIRVGIVQEKLYVWTPDTNPNDMIYGWRSQYFYVDKQDVSRITEETGRKLELGNDLNQSLTGLNELMKQFVDERTYNQISIKDSNSRLTGEVLRLCQDATGDAMKDLEGRVHRVAGANGHGGIENPKFPAGTDLEQLRARLIGTVVSDCYVRSDGIVELTDGNLQRIEQFKEETLRKFGDFNKEARYIKEENYYRLKIPSPYGRALNEWGIPSGDRTIMNYGLPKETENWSKESAIAYLQDMISQEGHIAEGKIRWERSNAINPGKKVDSYNLEPQLTKREIDLLQSKGLHYPGDYEGEKTVRWNIIQELAEDKNPKIAETAQTAQNICNIINENRNRLMDAEEKLARKLGIHVEVNPEEVSIYKSGRISVKWEARTNDTRSMIRWGLICSPNHPEKGVVLNKWLAKRDGEKIQQVIKELHDEGFNIPSDWREKINEEE